MVRGLAALGLVTGLAVGTVADWRTQTDVEASAPKSTPPTAFTGADGFHTYRLEALEILEQTVFHVDEKYVDPGRLDWEAMFVAFLQTLEQEVVSCVFARESGSAIVSIEAGDFRTVEEIETVTSGTELVEAARQVLALVGPHLVEAELPEAQGEESRRRALEYALVNGMLAEVLDPHTMLLPPLDADEMDDRNQGEFGGLGITVYADRGRLVISDAPRTGSPAESAGLRKDDHIVRIDGESTINMNVDAAVVRLKGPVGTEVVLEVAREGEAEPLKVPIERGRIPYDELQFALLDGNVLYVSIPSFHQEVDRQLADGLTRMRREAGGALRGVVLDLRDNPGGYYHEAEAVVDAFLDDGEIVASVDRAGQRLDSRRAEPEGTEPFYPLAVLMSPGSASASEIVAGALRNQDRAVIIGTRSFGKGSVQTLNEYYDGSKLKLTVSRYLLPGDRSIQSVGIGPDIALRRLVSDPEGRGLGGVLEMFGEELALREGDLPGALDADAWVDESAAYELPWVFERPKERPPRSERDPSKDYPVQLARDVLLAAPSARRGDVLSGAARVLSSHQRANEAAVTELMAEHGVDWRYGASIDDAKVVPISLALSPEAVTAGAPFEVTLTAKNVGDSPLYRVAAVAAEHPVLDGREFYFGHLQPGQSASWTVEVDLMPGYPNEHAPVTFSVRDSGPSPLGTVVTQLEVLQPEQPRLAWTWSFEDLGDGDGRLEPGESVALDLTVENLGGGATQDAYALVRNLSGRDLDIQQGIVFPGVLVDQSGKPCAAGALDCGGRLDPGTSWSGRLVVKPLSEDAGAVTRVELAIGDRVSYDWGAYARAGVQDVLETREAMSLTMGEPLPEGAGRTPPMVDITHMPNPISHTQRASVSGLVSDDGGLAHVMVFHGSDKVFHQGAGTGAALEAIPFTADVVLEDGVNTLVVVAINRDGLVSSNTVVTWKGGPELARAAERQGTP